MLTGNPRKIPMNQMLRERLDNFYQLAEDALCRTCCQEGFVSMNVVLCTELEELCKSLYALESKYKGELPLMDEEPREIRWADERKTMDAMANQIVLRGEEQRCFSASVKSRMEAWRASRGSWIRNMTRGSLPVMADVRLQSITS